MSVTTLGSGSTRDAVALCVPCVPIAPTEVRGCFADLGVSELPISVTVLDRSGTREPVDSITLSISTRKHRDSLTNAAGGSR
ncbi:hypothetical protein LV75_006391 [Actinokineospora diospyrosa]|uniref:Uncharacterized protein n=1 Tax=Actinokineospora diospyrosa TaxID=103728 RepID=A0ABT1IMU8_9PSEU|nr:hypothetical protein [Actinokineospora diospyrosa]